MAIRRGRAAVVDDGRGHAHLGGIDRIAYALWRIIVAFYSDALGAAPFEAKSVLV